MPLQPSRGAVAGADEVLKRYLKARIAAPRGSDDRREPQRAMDWLAAEALVVEVVRMHDRLHRGDVAQENMVTIARRTVPASCPSSCPGRSTTRTDCRVARPSGQRDHIFGARGVGRACPAGGCARCRVYRHVGADGQEERLTIQLTSSWDVRPSHVCWYTVVNHAADRVEERIAATTSLGAPARRHCHRDRVREPTGRLSDDDAMRFLPTLLVAGLVLTGTACSDDGKDKASAPLTTQPTGPTGAPSAPAPQSGSVLQKVALVENDLPDGVQLELIEGGVEVEGRVSLDMCGYEFTTEQARAERYQIESLRRPGGSCGEQRGRAVRERPRREGGHGGAADLDPGMPQRTVRCDHRSRGYRRSPTTSLSSRTRSWRS